MVLAPKIEIAYLGQLYLIHTCLHGFRKWHTYNNYSTVIPHFDLGNTLSVGIIFYFSQKRFSYKTTSVHH